MRDGRGRKKAPDKPQTRTAFVQLQEKLNGLSPMEFRTKAA
ncbi:hypothetical protein [Cohnella lubricantis]